MITKSQMTNTNEIVVKLMEVRSLIYTGVGYSYDVLADPDAIALVDSLIHRTLAKLTDQAAQGE